MKKELIKLEVKAMTKAKNLIPEIIEVIKKFDGKTPTKRFDTALKKIDRNLQFKTQFNSFIIDLFIENRHTIGPKGHANYIKNNSLNIEHTAITSCYGDGACQNGVIRADVLVERLNSKKDYFNRSINTITDQVTEIEKIIADHTRIKKEISNFTDNTSYIIMDYYNLNFK